MNIDYILPTSTVLLLVKFSCENVCYTVVYCLCLGHLPSSLPLGAMEVDDIGRSEGRKPDVGFKSKESDQLLDYLRTVQHAQFRLICIRVSHI